MERVASWNPCRATWFMMYDSWKSRHAYVSGTTSQLQVHAPRAGARRNRFLQKPKTAHTNRWQKQVIPPLNDTETWFYQWLFGEFVSSVPRSWRQPSQLVKWITFAQPPQSRSRAREHASRTPVQWPRHRARFCLTQWSDWNKNPWSRMIITTPTPPAPISLRHGLWTSYQSVCMRLKFETTCFAFTAVPAITCKSGRRQTRQKMIRTDTGSCDAACCASNTQRTKNVTAVTGPRRVSQTTTLKAQQSGGHHFIRSACLL
jgi:hypothetical protein